MATDLDFIEYVHAQAGLGTALTYRKMFGEYGLYFDGRLVLMGADNRLFLKPTQAGRRLLPSVLEAPIYPGSKLWFVIDEWLDDGELLQRLIRATAAELPLPKPKASKTGKEAPCGTSPKPANNAGKHHPKKPSAGKPSP